MLWAPSALEQLLGADMIGSRVEPRPSPKLGAGVKFRADAPLTHARRMAQHESDRLPTIRVRLVLFATACMALAVSAAGALYLSQARQEREAVQAEVRSAARTGAQFVDQEIAGAAALLSGLSVSPSLQSGDFAAFYRQASAVQAPPDSWFVLFPSNYVNRADQLVNTRRPFGAPPQSGESTEAVKNFIRKVVTTRQTQVSDLVYVPQIEDYVVGVGTPIIRNDEVVYVLVLALRGVLAAPSFEEMGSAYLGGAVDRSGKFLPERNPADRANKQPPFDTALLRDAGAEGVLDGVAPDGGPLYVAFARLDITGWTVFVATSKLALDAPVNRALLIIGIGGVLLLLAGIGIALLAGPGVTLPLQRRIAEHDKRFRIMADTVPSILFSADREGACDYVSERFYAYTGTTQGTAERLGWLAVVHPEDRARILHALANRSNVGRPTGDIELRLRAARGSYRWFAVRTTQVSSARGNGVRWFGTATDIDDLKRTETMLRQLSAQLMKSQDDERRRIAREIHDTTVQNIVAARIEIDQVHEGIILPGASAATALGEARDLLDQSLSELRTLSYLLHPPLLDELGLVSAVRWYVQGFEKRSGIAVSVDTPESMPRLPGDIETTLFRVVQEGLANVHRHSGSHEARVTLAWHPDRIGLEIADQGHGMPNPTFDATCDAGSLGVGIPGMRVRIQQIGGSLEVESSRNGTLLRVVVPQTEASVEKPQAARSQDVKDAVPWLGARSHCISRHTGRTPVSARHAGR